MHDIWNPWHGCVKVSEGCAHCYMYYLDKVRGQADGSEIYRTANMRYPLAKDRNGNYAACLHDERFLSRRSGRLAR